MARAAVPTNVIANGRPFAVHVVIANDTPFAVHVVIANDRVRPRGVKQSERTQSDRDLWNNPRVRPAIYILTNCANRVLYVGVTANLPQRLYAHRLKLDALSFTARYNLTKLVYYETHPTMEAAIVREKQLKGGSRARKIRLIEGANPQWADLAATLHT